MYIYIYICIAITHASLRRLAALGARPGGAPLIGNDTTNKQLIINNILILILILTHNHTTTSILYSNTL